MQFTEEKITIAISAMTEVPIVCLVYKYCAKVKGKSEKISKGFYSRGKTTWAD